MAKGQLYLAWDDTAIAARVENNATRLVATEDYWRRHTPATLRQRDTDSGQTLYVAAPADLITARIASTLDE